MLSSKPYIKSSAVHRLIVTVSFTGYNERQQLNNGTILSYLFSLRASTIDGVSCAEVGWTVLCSNRVLLQYT